MSVDREAIYLALFDRLVTKLHKSNGGPFTVIGRRVVGPPTLTAQEQPALFIWETSETKNYKVQASSTPMRVPGGTLALGCKLILFCYRPQLTQQLGQETALTATQINELLGAIDDALEPDFPNAGKLQTLSGMVYHCLIDGTTAIADSGSISQQASAIVPVTILVPQ